MISTYLVRRDYGAFQTQVDPLSVRYMKSGDEWPGYIRRWPFLLCPGNWDVSEREHAPFREDLMRELFVEGRHYTETGVYRWLVRLLEEGGHTRHWPCRSRQEIVTYFQNLQRLGQSIRDKGILPPSSDPTAPRNGITVRIARDGSILKCGEGTHRLAIARVLEIPRVPVVVDLIHTRWAYRKIARNPGTRGRHAVEMVVERIVP